MGDASAGLRWCDPWAGSSFVIYTHSQLAKFFIMQCSPLIVPANKAGLILGFSSGNMSGLVLMLFVLFAFAMPSVQPWSFLPDEPWFGIDQSLFEHDRLIGPLCGIWILIFTLPVLFLHQMERYQPFLEGFRERRCEGSFETIRQVRHYANIARYLLARMLYNDGMAAVLTFAGIYASGVLVGGL